jgi:O-methyltransferase domain/Dimerisation domain
MPPPEQSPSAALRRLANGFQVSQALFVAATLGIADELRAGPRSSADLAEATESHPGALHRLLRALASVDVLHEGPDGRFSLTELGECLRSDAPQPVGGWAALVGRPYFWAAWGALLHSVRTGENAMTHVTGADPWEYRAERPEENAIFDRAMTDLSRRTNGAVLEAYDFSRFDTVIDVGGGRGALLAAILVAHPAVRGVLFDRPHVVEGADGVLAAAGAADRCTVVAGDFFQAVPEGGDAYLLRAVLHDWEDPEAIAILRSCRRAMREHAALLVLERELGGPNENPDAKFSDLNMLVMPGGRERTVQEFTALFDSAGFEFAGTTPTAAAMSVIEARPAPAPG